MIVGLAIELNAKTVVSKLFDPAVPVTIFKVI